MKKLLFIFLIISHGVYSQMNITGVEYYWGNADPGSGNGNAISAVDGEFNNLVESIITTYTNTHTSNGPVLFNIRVKDVNDNWGPVFKKVVFILDGTSTSREFHLSGFEYFFGNFDPGEGSGVPIVVFDGALDNAVETVFRNQATWDIASGPILFNIRAMDVDGNWGPLFKKAVFPYGTNTNPSMIAEGDAMEVCEGGEVTLTYEGL